MSQTSYSINQTAGMLGMLADSRVKHTESMIALEALPIGRGAIVVGNHPDQAQLPEANVSTLVFDADFVASNSIVITVNGEATAAVVYATSHDNTMNLVLAAIRGLSTVASATLDSTDSDNRTFIIKVIDAPAVVTEAITGGSSQATGTATKSLDVTSLMGIVEHSHALEGGLPGSTTPVQYPANGVANILRRGAIYVHMETAFDPDVDTLYIRHEANGATKLVGQFRNDSDSGKATSLASLPIVVRNSLSASGLAVLEINLP